MAEFTCSSWMVSGGGLGRAWPIAPYTEVLVTISPLGLLPFPFSPMLTATRLDVTWLVDLPLKMLLVLTPLREKLLLVSRWPLAQMAWLPKPAFVPAVFRRSAFTPGLRIAAWGKLPVPSGISAICLSTST